MMVARLYFDLSAILPCSTFFRWVAEHPFITMDPLSIVSSLLAVMGATESAARGTQRLWNLRRAPETLAALEDEISDFQVLLDFLKDASSTTQGGRDPSANPVVLCALRQGTSALQHLRSLVHTHLKKKNDKKVRYRGFLKSKRLLQAHKEMEKAKCSLGIAVTALAFSRQNYMHESISLKIDSNNLDLYRRQSKLVVYPAAQSDGMNINYNNGRMSTPKQSNVAISVTNTIDFCHQTCPCVCHTRGSGHTPYWLQSILGVLCYDYFITPSYFRRLCDCHSCESDGGSIKLEYRLPAYAPTCMIYIHVSWNTTRGIYGNWNLRPSEYIPRGAEAIYDLLDPLQTPRQLEKFLDMHKISSRAISSDDGFSFLYSAMVRNRWDMVEILLSRGADLHSQEPTLAGITPAQYAWTEILVSQSSLLFPEKVRQSLDEMDTLELLRFNTVHGIVTGLLSLDLERQLDLTPGFIEDVDFHGRTPLSWSVRRGDCRLTPILIARGANVNQQDAYGNTPLHYAAQNDDPQCVKMLVKAGANINRLGGIVGAKLTPLTAATLAGSIASAVTLLESGADPNLGQFTSLFAAAFMGRMNIERYLRRYGACVDGSLVEGHAMVMSATADLTPASLESLRGIDTSSNYNSDTTLNFAAGCGNLSTLKSMRPGGLLMTRRELSMYWSAFLYLRSSYERLQMEQEVEEEKGEVQGAPKETKLET